jgi:hypothetical protein
MDKTIEDRLTAIEAQLEAILKHLETGRQGFYPSGYHFIEGE